MRGRPCSNPDLPRSIAAASLTLLVLAGCNRDLPALPTPTPIPTPTPTPGGCAPAGEAAFDPSRTVQLVVDSTSWGGPSFRPYPCAGALGSGTSAVAQV